MSTGFRAPGLSQIAFSKVATNVIAGEFIDFGIFPVDNPASLALGAKPLQGRDVDQLQRRHGHDPDRQPHDHRRLLPHPINDRILLGATFDDYATLDILADAGFGNIGGVQYFTNGLNTRTQGVDFTANYGSRRAGAARSTSTPAVN